MTLIKVKLTKSELKVEKALLKEVMNCSCSPLNSDDEVKVEIVDKAAEVIINCNMPKWTHKYWTKFSSLSEDAKKAARALEVNYFNTSDSGEFFSVSTTHDLDSWTFSKGAIDSLAAYLLKKVFTSAENIERYDSCRETAGSKYRPSHKKFAEKVLKLDGKVYTANTYIYKNGALRHSDKEFDTAVAAYNYLHRKMINYAGTTDATQTIESYDGLNRTEIYYNATNGKRGETTTNAEIQKLIDAYDAEIDARIVASESNAKIIAYIDEYAVDADLATEVEIENAKNIKEIKREIKYTHKNIFIRKMEELELEGGIETLKKLNRLCGREFDARLQRKENLYDLMSVAEKIADNLETIKRREERIAGIKRGIEIDERELLELETSLAKVVTPAQEEPPTVEEIENAPSVEEIFTKVINESGIKAKDNGKYYLHINDNYRCQQVCKNFTTLQDAIKIARIMYREVRKVSRNIEVIVESRTVDISEYCFRADEWTTFFKINDGKEFVKRREMVEIIAELDDRTVAEVQSDICSYDYDYGVYKNSAKKGA